jgi:hypothetical protein
MALPSTDYSKDRRQFALLTGQWKFPRSLQRIVEGSSLASNQMVEAVSSPTDRLSRFVSR